MPIYEYRCSSCGFQKEYLRKIADPLISVCPECGKSTFAKMLSAAGFQLKGTGWYATDFKNSGSKPTAKPTAEGGDKAAAKSDSSTAKSDSSTAKSDSPATKSDSPATKSDSSAGMSDKKDAASKSGGNTNSKSEAAA